MEPSPQDATMSSKMRAHRKVILAIDTNYYGLVPFAIHEVIKVCDVSTASVKRTLISLIAIGMVKHKPNSYRDRNYCITDDWKDAAQVWKAYEESMLFKTH